MKSIRKSLCLLLAFALMIFCNLPAGAAASGSFSDIPQNAYYADAAAYCSEHGLISGTGNGKFSPNINLSRGMLVAILWRNEGSPAATGSSFSDVRTGSYYETAISWAAEKEIVSGYGGNRFGPDDPITREQFATILYRYGSYQQKDLSVNSNAPFADSNAISVFAQTAVSWARDKGIVSGKSGNRFDPKGNTTRAEAVTMIYRYLNTNENTTPDVPTPPPSGDTPRVLVAYFSCTDTTKGIALSVQNTLGESAALHAITPAVPYTAADLQYYTNGRADQEQADPNARPGISNSVANFANYDVIFLGYPIWHGQAPKIIYTFLESYDFTGKTVIPFCTSHSSSIGSSDANLHPLAPDADWQQGRRFGAEDIAAAGSWAASFPIF